MVFDFCRETFSCLLFFLVLACGRRFVRRFPPQLFRANFLPSTPSFVALSPCRPDPRMNSFHDGCAATEIIPRTTLISLLNYAVLSIFLSLSFLFSSEAVAYGPSRPWRRYYFRQNRAISSRLSRHIGSG